MKPRMLALFSIFTFAASAPAQLPPAPAVPLIHVPEGYTVELAAGPPLVEHPIMAGFDDRGRLYVAENAGINMQRKELEEKLPNSVVRLEDTDGDGRFDKRTVFADKLTFPQGALWHNGWLYVASSGAIWRFKDRDDNGVAEVREKIVSSFGYTGNAADVHGCFLGPEGRIWWCEGRHGHEIADSAGTIISKGKAARIFSCKPDGSDVRIHCGGGMDNPVEIDWTEEGEMLGTVNIFYAKRGDCLVHWMHGGLYPRHDQPAVLAEFKKTGDLLDAVHDYGHVAVSGCCRLRGAGILPANSPAESAPTFLVTEFNTHKVVLTTLSRDGSTFRAETSDFLQAASDDLHPTDVLEDADGSILVVDTGGWFRIGCPTSQVAKPNILGAIYRVRRTDAPKPADPRGLTIEWDKLDAPSLVDLLGDDRPAVQERAIQKLAALGDKADPHFARTPPRRPDVDRNVIWTHARSGTPKAIGVIRHIGLDSRDESVLTVSLYCAGILGDQEAVGPITEILGLTESPRIAREAATALGRLRHPAAIPGIFEWLAKDTDRVLEHALIYALIEIDDPQRTAIGLRSTSPRIRRAALIALDQMPSGNLQREQVAALLDTSDQPLLTAALDVISRREGWSAELVSLAGKLLDQPALTESEASLVSGSLVAFAKDEKVQALVAAGLNREKCPAPVQSLLLDVMGRSDLRPIPQPWITELSRLLDAHRMLDSGVILEAVHVAGSASEPALDEQLKTLIAEATSPELRIAAIVAVAPRLTAVSAEQFDLLKSGLSAESRPQTRLLAARGLCEAPLSTDQMLSLTSLFETTGPLEMRLLMAALMKSPDDRVGVALVEALGRSTKYESLSDQDFDVLARQYPAAKEHIDLLRTIRRTNPSAKENAEKLAAIERELPTGGVLAGRQVFFGRKAACSACHRVGAEGGKIGPDLSKVGERRTDRDLLEAIVLPSASISRGYESHAILTEGGLNLTGLIVRETGDSLFLRTADQREVRLKRGDIEAQKPSQLSIMPAGLEAAVTRQDLADLLAYLRSLK